MYFCFASVFSMWNLYLTHAPRSVNWGWLFFLHEMYIMAIFFCLFSLFFVWQKRHFIFFHALNIFEKKRLFVYFVFSDCPLLGFLVFIYLSCERLREKFYPEKSSTPRKSLPRKKSTPEKIHNFDPIKLILEKLKALTR